jgi:hypothetical protein
MFFYGLRCHVLYFTNFDVENILMYAVNSVFVQIQAIARHHGLECLSVLVIRTVGKCIVHTVGHILTHRKNQCIKVVVLNEHFSFLTKNSINLESILEGAGDENCYGSFYRLRMF